MSTRYRGTSVEFGERLRDDIIKRNKEVAKEQEDFAKKIAGAKFVVKGLSSFMNDRLDTFNNSMLDEKTFLSSTQANAKSILDQHQTNVQNNVSTEDYISNKIAESWKKTVQDNVEGIMVEVPDKNGNIVSRQAYEVPIATLKSLENFKIGNKEYATYQDLIDERVTLYNNVLEQARNVPKTPDELEVYLDKYRDQQNIPSNVAQLFTKPIRRFLRGETRETLKDKVNKTTSQNLSSDVFKNFTTFAKDFKAYADTFPNADVSFLSDFKADLERDETGNIIDKKFKKIITKMDKTTEFKTVTKDDPQTNQRSVEIVAIPKVVTTYVDNTSSSRVGEADTIVEGKQVLVLLNAPLINSFNNELNPFGREKWAEYQQNTNVAANPVKSFSDFLMTGQVEGGKEANLYLKGELEMTRIFESFLAAAGKDFAGLISPPAQGDESDEAYAAILEANRKENDRIMREVFDGITEQLRAFDTTLDVQQRGRGF